MSSWSGRAQVEPLAALAAVFALGVGLALYAGVLEPTLPRLTPGREMAPTATDRFTSTASTFGAIAPPLADPVASATPTGHELNATVRTANETWTAGPSTVDSGACDRRRVSIRVAPGRVRPGRLEVCVWRAR